MFDNETIVFIIIGVVVLVLIYCIFSNTKVIEKLTEEEQLENGGLLDNLKSIFSIVLNLGKLNTGTSALTCKAGPDGNIVCREKGPLANSAGAELIVGQTIKLPWPDAANPTEYIIQGVVGGNPFDEFKMNYSKYTKSSFFSTENELKKIDTGDYCDPYKQKRMFKKFVNNLITKVILKRKYKSFKEWFKVDKGNSYNSKNFIFNAKNKLVEVDKDKKEILIDIKTKIEIEKLYDNKDFVYNGKEAPGYIQKEEIEMNLKKFGNSIFVKDSKTLNKNKLLAYLKTKPEYKNTKTAKYKNMGYEKIISNLTNNKDLQQTYYEAGVLSKDSEFILSLRNIEDLMKDFFPISDDKKISENLRYHRNIYRNNKTIKTGLEISKLKKIEEDIKKKKKEIKEILQMEYLGVISKLYGTIYADYGAIVTYTGKGKIQTTEEQDSKKYNIHGSSKVSRMKRVQKDGKDGSLCYYHHYSKPDWCENYIEQIKKNTAGKKALNLLSQKKDKIKIQKFNTIINKIESKNNKVPLCNNKSVKTLYDSLWQAGGFGETDPDDCGDWKRTRRSALVSGCSKSDAFWAPSRCLQKPWISIPPKGLKQYKQQSSHPLPGRSTTNWDKNQLGLHLSSYRRAITLLNAKNEFKGALTPDIFLNCTRASLIDVNEWCGPAALISGKKRTAANSRNHTTIEKRERNSNNKFAINTREIYSSRRIKRQGDASDLTVPQIYEYDEEERETKKYEGLDYFYKPIYFFVNDLRAYDIKMKKKLKERLEKKSKYTGSIQKQNIEAYGYSYFPSDYSIEKQLVTTNLPSFPTALFCFPYIYQVHSEKNKVEKKLISTNTTAERAKYLKEQKKAQILSHGLNYALHSVTYRTAMIKSDGSMKKRLISFEEPMLDNEIGTPFIIEASELQIQIDEIFWNDIDGISEEYDKRIGCKLTGKNSDGITENKNCSKKPDKCKFCYLDTPISVSLVEDYIKNTNKIVITEVDYKKLFIDNKFLSDLFETNGKLIVNVDDHTDPNNKMLIFDDPLFSSNKGKGTKLSFNVKNNYPISMCPDYIVNHKKNTGISEKDMDRMFNEMKSGMKDKSNKPIEITDANYRKYLTFYNCYKGVMESIDNDEKREIMSDINEIDPLIDRLTDYAFKKGQSNTNTRSSCNYIKRLPGVSQTIMNDKTLYPNEDLIDAIGTTAYDKCNDFINYDCKGSFKTVCKGKKLYTDRKTGFKVTNPDAVEHLNETTGDCTYRTKTEIAKKNPKTELDKQKIMNKNRDEKIELLLDSKKAQAELKKLKSKLLILKKDEGKKRTIVDNFAKKANTDAEGDDKQKKQALIDAAKATVEHDKAKINLQMRQEKIEEYESILKYAKKQEKNQNTKLNLDRNHIKTIANMKTPYYEEQIMYNYDKCVDGIADYLP
jgi:hypothetical protein